MLLRKSCLVRSLPKAVDKQRKVVGRKCAGSGNGDVPGKTIQHDDDENKKQDQGDPPDRTTAIDASSSSSSSSSSNNGDIGSLPATAHLVATYVASYREGGKLCNLRIKMVFTSLQPTGGRGFAIDGSGLDSDGTCNIIEGRMAPDGQAYWIEQQGSRQILSRGVFTTTAKTTCCMTVRGGIDEDGGIVPEFFHGRWRSSNGVAASYINFTLDQTNQEQQPVAVVTKASTTTAATTATTANTMHQEHDTESGTAERAPVAAA
jgi:hypothetical protein